MAKEYQVVNGTSYDARTKPELVELLEELRQSNTRVHFYYGDTETGEIWDNDRHPGDTGKIGRSMGSIKIPLVIYNRRSIGGGGLLDHCIVKIVTTRGKRVLYEGKGASDVRVDDALLSAGVGADAGG